MREEEAIIAVIAIMALGCFGSILVRNVAWVLKSWMETGLKRDMVARGYSADEIIAVVVADRRCPSKHSLHDVPPAKPIRQPAFPQ
jgi:hypothetical protein